MAAIGKSLEFEEVEIDELLELKYARTADVRSPIHPLPRTGFQQDLPRGPRLPEVEIHVQAPRGGRRARRRRSRTTKRATTCYPISKLLAGTANVEKQDKWPADWAKDAFADDTKRATYLEENDLTGLDLGIAKFHRVLRGAESADARTSDRLRWAWLLPSRTRFRDSENEIRRPGDRSPTPARRAT